MTKCYLCDGDAPPADAGRPPVCERCALPMDARLVFPKPMMGMTVSEWMERATEELRALWPEQALQPVDNFVVPKDEAPPAQSVCKFCGQTPCPYGGPCLPETAFGTTKAVTPPDEVVGLHEMAQLSPALLARIQQDFADDLIAKEKARDRKGQAWRRVLTQLEERFFDAAPQATAGCICGACPADGPFCSRGV